MFVYGGDVTIALAPTTDGNAYPVFCIDKGKILSSPDRITVTGLGQHNCQDSQKEQKETPQTPTGPPPSPINLATTVNTDASITLNWDAPDDHSRTGSQVLRHHPSRYEDALEFTSKTPFLLPLPTLTSTPQRVKPTCAGSRRSSRPTWATGRNWSRLRALPHFW